MLTCLVACLAECDQLVFRQVLHLIHEECDTGAKIRDRCSQVQHEVGEVGVKRTCISASTFWVDFDADGEAAAGIGL